MNDVVQDPTWCLHDSHVHIFLQLIADYWADYWGVQRTTLHPPMEAGPIASLHHDRAKRLRVMRLRECAWHDTCMLPLSTDTTELEGYPERRLYAAVMRKAVLDWASLHLTPARPDQRIALNCYW